MYLIRRFDSFEKSSPPIHTVSTVKEMHSRVRRGLGIWFCVDRAALVTRRRRHAPRLCAGVENGKHPCSDELPATKLERRDNVSAVIVTRNDAYARLQMIWNNAVQISLARMIEQFDEVVVVDFNSVHSG